VHPDAVVLLNEQYRMHENIMRFSSKEFYDDKLLAHTSVSSRLLFKDDAPFLFIDTAGCGFTEKIEGTSTANAEEAAFVFNYLTNFITGLEQFSIAVISPYREQIRLLKELFTETPDNISINTIDSFQGQERDMVVISMTRSNPEGEIGFLSDTRRMNVAMTRAKKKLVMIGDSSTLARLPFYTDLISYSELIGGYQSAWDYIGLF